MLDGVERLGNKVPHPAIMFFYLILFVIVLSHVLFVLGVSVTEEIAVPVPLGVPPELLRGHDVRRASTAGPTDPTATTTTSRRADGRRSRAC